MVDLSSERDAIPGAHRDVFRLNRAEDGPESGWPAWPVTVKTAAGAELTVAMGQYLPTGPSSAEPAPDGDLLARARGGVLAEVVNALKDLYERSLPVWISIPVTERLMKVYIHLREQGGPVDPLPPVEESRDQSPSQFVQRWLRGGVLAIGPAHVAESMLARYVVSAWQDAAGGTGESIEGLLVRGGAGRLTPDTLATEHLARRTEPWLVEQVWEIATCCVEELQLHQASARDLEQLLGLRPVEWGKLFAYRDAGPMPDTAPVA